jgi:hypothetical protein
MRICTLCGHEVHRTDWRDHLLDHHPGAAHFTATEVCAFFTRRTSRPPTRNAIDSRKDG